MGVSKISAEIVGSPIYCVCCDGTKNVIFKKISLASHNNILSIMKSILTWYYGFHFIIIICYYFVCWLLVLEFEIAEKYTFAGFLDDSQRGSMYNRRTQPPAWSY